MLETIFDPAVLSPNLVYLGIVLGLWLGVTSAYIPGTGIAEGAAALLLLLGIGALTTLPTNWLAFGLLVLGIGAYLVLPFFDERYSGIADIGVIFQAAGSYFLFDGMQVAPLLIVLTVLTGIGYNRLLLRPMMRSLKEPTESDEANEVMGKRGRVVTDLNPVGTVYVNREHWRARSDDEHLTRDTAVDVIGQEGLELIVRKAKRETAPEYVSYASDDELIRKNGNLD
jgi:membrane-bound serine protease (ClpP class)